MYGLLPLLLLQRQAILQCRGYVRYIHTALASFYIGVRAWPRDWIVSLTRLPTRARMGAPAWRASLWIMHLSHLGSAAHPNKSPDSITRVVAVSYCAGQWILWFSSLGSWVLVNKNLNKNPLASAAVPCKLMKYAHFVFGFLGSSQF